MKLFVKVCLYLLAIAICIVFSLYLSAEVGWTFAYILICAPIFSLGITFFLTRRNRITVSADVDRTMLYKGETATLRITARNRSIFPVPAVKVHISAQGGLEPEESVSSYVISIPPRSDGVIEIHYKAKVWGRFNIGAESVFLHDFMEFFRFRLPCLNAVCTVKVFPDIPEIQGDSPLLRSAAESARFADDSEDTRESDNVPGFSGMPGYTHREYVEGDPIRRINWKLSSKRDKYLVRLDDEIESVRQNIVLDSAGGADIFVNERAVEGVLAAALGLLKYGFESTVYCRINGLTESFDISEPADVTALQTQLADFTFLSAAECKTRIPTEEIAGDSGAKAMMIYTPLFNPALSAEIASAEEQGMVCAVVTSDEMMSGSANRVWRLSEDYSAEMIQ